VESEDHERTLRRKEINMEATQKTNISLYKEEDCAGRSPSMCTVPVWGVTALLGVIAAYSLATIPVMWAQNKLIIRMQKMELIMVDAKIATYKDDGKFVVLWKGSHVMDSQPKIEHE